MTQLGDGEIASCSAVTAAEKISGGKIEDYGNDIDKFFMENILDLKCNETTKDTIKQERTKSSILSLNNNKCDNNYQSNTNLISPPLQRVVNNGYHPVTSTIPTTTTATMTIIPNNNTTSTTIINNHCPGMKG